MAAFKSQYSPLLCHFFRVGYHLAGEQNPEESHITDGGRLFEGDKMESQAPSWISATVISSNSSFVSLIAYFKQVCKRCYNNKSEEIAGFKWVNKEKRNGVVKLLRASECQKT